MKCYPCNGTGKSCNPGDGAWKCAECEGTGIRPARRLPKRRVIRVDLSPMNPKIKIAQLECGHDVYRNRKPRVGALVICDKCAGESK